jgi:hypothetical protein
MITRRSSAVVILFLIGCNGHGAGSKPFTGCRPPPLSLAAHGPCSKQAQQLVDFKDKHSMAWLTGGNSWSRPVSLPPLAQPLKTIAASADSAGALVTKCKQHIDFGKWLRIA